MKQKNYLSDFKNVLFTDCFTYSNIYFLDARKRKWFPVKSDSSDIFYIEAPDEKALQKLGIKLLHADFKSQRE